MVRVVLRVAERVAAGAAGPEVGAPRPLIARAGAVAPVVAVGEAAARPADGALRQLLHPVDDGLPDPLSVGDLRAFADPDAVVDDAAEVLGEVAIEIRHDGAD